MPMDKLDMNVLRSAGRANSHNCGTKESAIGMACSAPTPATWQECLLQKAENLRAEAHKLETLARAMREPIYPPEAEAVLRDLILTGLHR